MNLHNPFKSKTFTTIWSKHFASEETHYQPDFIPSLQFIKHKALPLYKNVGTTFTKGIDYSLELKHTEKFEKSVFLIYDVPEYFEIDTQTNNRFGIYRSKQYPGFLIDLGKFRDLNAYMASAFSKSSRYKLKKYRKRFEASFSIRYVMYRHEIQKEAYDDLFQKFRLLLEKRFDDKQITNNNLNAKEWQFYYEVTYPMLLEGKASLFVIYNEDVPIGITLNFFSEDVLFDAITVFDIDYSKFHLGSITIMALLEWCMENKFKIFDFSKGYFDYKTRWATKRYNFEYHIYYDTNSIVAKTLAFSIKQLFDLKQTLREKNINDKLHRFTYRIKNKAEQTRECKNYIFNDLDENVLLDKPLEAEINIETDRNVRLMLFEYLYLSDEHYRHVKIYQVPDKIEQYYIIGKTKSVLAALI